MSSKKMRFAVQYLTGGLADKSPLFGGALPPRNFHRTRSQPRPSHPSLQSNTVSDRSCKIDF